MNFVKFLLVLVLGFWGSTAFSKEFPKMNPKPGEWCDYRNNQGATFRHEVTSVSEDGSFSMKVGQSIQHYNSRHQLISRDDIKYSPAFFMVDYPVKVGAKGGGEFSYPHARQYNVTVYAKSEIVSTSLESVTVPAGTFEAIKVLAHINYRLSHGFSGRMISVAWFPVDSNIKRYVKTSSLDEGNGQRNELELISCGGGS